jgi:hypothetical protein
MNCFSDGGRVMWRLQVNKEYHSVKSFGFCPTVSMTAAWSILLIAVLSLLLRVKEILDRKSFILTEYFHGFCHPICSSNVIIRQTSEFMYFKRLKYTLWNTDNFLLRSFYTSNLFVTLDGFFLAGKEKQWDEGSVRIPLGYITQASG